MTFETNSSSTHSITICPKETYEKWMAGKLLYDDWNERFVEEKELTPYDYEQAGEKYEACNGKYLTYLDWCCQHEGLGKYSKRYKTKSGDEIVAFGYYGYDG